MKGLWLLLLSALVACSGEQMSSAGESLGRQVNLSQRDRAIRNAQHRISDEERCAEFKDELLVVGRRHNAAAKASFFMDLDKVKKAAEVAGCIRGQTSGPRAVIYKSGDTEQALQSGVDEKEAAWNAFYQPSEECLKSVSVECGNAHIRARREFERKYEAGELWRWIREKSRQGGVEQLLDAVQTLDFQPPSSRHRGSICLSLRRRSTK